MKELVGEDRDRLALAVSLLKLSFSSTLSSQPHLHQTPAYTAAEFVKVEARKQPMTVTNKDQTRNGSMSHEISGQGHGPCPLMWVSPPTREAHNHTNLLVM